MFVNLVKFITRVLFRVFYFARVEGLDKIPKNGKLIIASNHLTNADPPFVGAFAGKQRIVKFLAKKELFKTQFSSFIFEVLGCVPVDRAKGDLGALKSILKLLKDENCVILFPEGTRSKTGEIQEPKSGIGFITYQSKAPVLCARIFNKHKFPWVFGIKLKFGKMIDFDQENFKTENKYQDFSLLVMKEINSIKE